MEFLKPILGDELYAQVSEKLAGSKVKLADLASGMYVSKDKYADIETQLTEARTTITERDTQLNDLKRVGNPAELQAQIAQLQEQHKKDAEAAEQRIVAMQFENALTNALTTAKAKNPKAVAALIDRQVLKLKGDNIHGLKEQIEAIRQENGFLFADEPDPAGGSEIKGGETKTTMNDFLRGAK